jgi:phospholipid-binding lipoprotein MlaA
MKLRQLFLISLFSLVAVSAYAEEKDPDPWRKFNEKSHNFNEFFDRNLLKPVAKGYKKVTPDALNKGITNFFNNLGEPINFVNDLLQAKPKEAAVDFGRFAVNSTVGLLGFFDIATRIEWHRNNEDLGQTLGKWGVPSGPYVVIPFLGPSTVRDGLVKLPESFTNLNPLYAATDDTSVVIGSTVINIIDTRADLLEAEKILTGMGNRYTAMRDVYLSTREYDVKDGEVEDEFMSEDMDW